MENLFTEPVFDSGTLDNPASGYTLDSSSALSDVTEDESNDSSFDLQSAESDEHTIVQVETYYNVDFFEELYTQAIPLGVGLSFALSTLLALFTYGAFKALGFVRIKNK